MFAHEARLLSERSGKLELNKLVNDLTIGIDKLIEAQAKQGEYHVEIRFSTDYLETYSANVVNKALSVLISNYNQRGFLITTNNKRADGKTTYDISWEEE